MAIDERAQYVASTLDIAWIIALWHFIHGGDPSSDPITAQTTELMARALVAQLGGTKPEASKDTVEKLAALGVKVVLKLDGQSTEVKTTKEFHERYSVEQGKNPPITCMSYKGHLACFNPYFLVPVEHRRP
jgi:hypothetical protein